MDLGLDRLIEMFEERFGRRVATVLLALVGLGVAGLALHTIYTTLLVPLAQALLGAFNFVSAIKAPRLPDIATLAAQIGAIILATAGFVVLVRVRLQGQKKIDASFRAIQERVANLEYEKRTAEQERDALQYFMKRAGGSPALHPPPDNER